MKTNTGEKYTICRKKVNKSYLSKSNEQCPVKL